MQGTAEQLPFGPATFDHVLTVTTICFVESAAGLLAEAHRVLKPAGTLVVGFIDRDSPLGRQYVEHQAASDFYRDATFYSSAMVGDLMVKAGFRIERWAQTIAGPVEPMPAIEPVRPGRGARGLCRRGRVEAHGTGHRVAATPAAEGAGVCRRAGYPTDSRAASAASVSARMR